MYITNRPNSLRFLALRKLFSLIAIAAVLFSAAPPQRSVQAAAALNIYPISWNIVGLDSNNVNVGPNLFPVGVRVCNEGDAPVTNVTSTFAWDTATDPWINLRTGTLDAYQDVRAVADLAQGDCTDFYYEVEVTRAPESYGKTRRFTITADSDQTGVVFTPAPREIFVERLISQNRNAVTTVKLDGVVVPNGGTMSLAVGNTYNLQLVGSTATNGYNQLESFVSLPNTIFRVNSVASTYTAKPDDLPLDRLYADGCGWDSNPLSATYRSCVVNDGKAGGGVTVNYNVTILSGGGTNLTLNTMLFDFSGSSYHYNADFSSSARFVSIVTPVSFSKAFSPASITPAQTSTLTFTLSNSTGQTVSGVSFADVLPSSPAQMTAAGAPTTSGCGTPDVLVDSEQNVLSFSEGSIAAGGTCTVSLPVSAPAGSYTNTTTHLFVNGIDTSQSASANLTVATASAGVQSCGVPLASWTFPTGTNITAPVPSSSSVSASAAIGAGLNPVLSPQNNTIPSTGSQSWGTDGSMSTSATLAPGDNDYFQFAVDTTNLTQVNLSFAARRTQNGPKNWAVYYGTSVTPPGDPAAGMTAAMDTKDVWQPSGTLAFTENLNPTGLTYFRIFGYNAQNSSPGSDMYLDDVVFSGCGIPQPPAITKEFSPALVPDGEPATLVFTLANPTGSVLTEIAFSDLLPSGLEVASPPQSSTTCGGTFAPLAGDTNLSFSGGTLSASANCQVAVDVIAGQPGLYRNVSGRISALESGTNTGPSGIAEASLAVLAPPVLAVSFSPNPIYSGETTTLTYTLTNPNEVSLTGASFTEMLPGDIGVAGAPNVVTTCGGTLDPLPGAILLSFSGGTIPAGGSCTVQVDVTSEVVMDHTYNTGTVATAVPGLVSNWTQATLSVIAQHPGIALSKQVSASPAGPWTQFAVVAPETPVYYRFTIENTGDVELDNLTFSDADLDATACAWPAALPAASPTQDPAVTCVLGPFMAQSGLVQNTATAQASYAGLPNIAIQTADYVGAATDLFLVKQVSSFPIGPWTTRLEDVAPLSDIYYKFTVINTGEAPLSDIVIDDPLLIDGYGLVMESCQLMDPLPAGGASSCVVGPIGAVESGTGLVNTAHAQVGEGEPPDIFSPDATAEYMLAQPDLRVAKTNAVWDTALVGTPFTWTVTVENYSFADAVFQQGQLILSDALPAGAAYSEVAIGDFLFVTDYENIHCEVIDSELLCAADAGDVTIGALGSFTLTYTAAPSLEGSLENSVTVDPDEHVDEEDEENNVALNTVAVNNEAADLTITITDGTAAYVPGGTLTYTVTVSNIGPSAVTGALVEAELPAQITDWAWTCSDSAGGAAGCTPAAGAGAPFSDLVNLPVGAAITYTVTASLAADAAGSLVTTVTIAPPAGVTDPVLATNTASDVDDVEPQSDLLITKTDGATSYVPGEQSVYTIVVANNGPSDAPGAEIQDAIPPQVSAWTWVCESATGGASGCTPAADSSSDFSDSVDLPAGSTLTYTVTASLSPAAAGNLTNTAQVISPEGWTDPEPGNDSASDTDTADPLVDLGMAITDGHSTYLPGGTVVYTVVVTNAGPSDAPGSLVSAALPANLAGWTWTCTGATGGAAGCTPGSGAFSDTLDLPAGGSVTYTVTAQVAADASGMLEAVVEVASDEGRTDTDPLNNSDDDRDEEGQQPVLTADLLITKSDGVSALTAGTNTTYHIRVTNLGPDLVSGAVVSDPLGAGLEFVSIACSAAAGNLCTGSPSGLADLTGAGLALPDLEAGEFYEVDLTARVTAASGTVRNTATVDVPEDVQDSDPENNLVTDENTVDPAQEPQVDLAVTLTNGVTAYQPGETIEYTVVVSNMGPSGAPASVVSAALPAGIASWSWACAGVTGSAAGCSAGSGSFSDTLDLPAGSTVTYLVTALVASDAAGDLQAAVSVSAAEGLTDTDPANNNATHVDTPAQLPVDYAVYLPVMSSQERTAVMPWGIDLGYEDLPLAGNKNDYDYNDWNVAVSGTFTYTTGTTSRLEEMSLSFLPRAHGASYDHTLRIRIPAGTFASGGTALLTTYDQNHQVLSTQTRTFQSGTDSEFVIFAKTSDALPGSEVNSVEGKPAQAPQRYVDLKLIFSTPFSFVIPENGLSQAHGEGLFFDPVLEVLNTGEQIRRGDLRLLSVPDLNWRWPEERVRIDQAYPLVIYRPGTPPGFTFPSLWWRTSNQCTYNGVTCPLK